MLHLLRVIPAFAATALLLAILPGQGVAMLLRQTISGGRESGLLAAFGTGQVLSSGPGPGSRHLGFLRSSPHPRLHTTLSASLVRSICSAWLSPPSIRFETHLGNLISTERQP
jgi:hypothetical protein